jgi:aspartate aminotransferase/aminotransferase
VLVIPGGVFSEQDTHFRICYTVPDDKLREGAEILCGLAGAQ